MSHPTLKVEISFTETPSYAPSWQDVSSYILEEGTDINRGRSDELEGMAAGTATVTLFNNSRAFDPDNASSPYYPYVRPMQRIRISAVWSGTTYILFVGYIQAWQPSRATFGKATVALSCVDGLGTAFAQAAIPATVTAGSMVTTGVTSLSGGDRSLFAASPTDPNQSGMPMSAIRIYSAGGNVNGGSFRVSYNGNWTAYIAASTAPQAVCIAIEALLGMQPNSVFYFATVTSLAYDHSIRLYLGGQFIGRDLSSTGLFTVDTSLLTGTGTIQYQIEAPAIPYTPGIMGRVGGRTIQATMVPASGFTSPGGNANLVVYGVPTGSRGISITGTGSRFNTVNNPVLNTTPLEQVFNIYTGNSIANSTDAGKTITVAYVTGVIPGALSGTMAATAAVYAGWPPEQTRIDTGVSTLLEIDPLNQTPATVLKTIAQSEGGVVFISRDGYLTFRDRSSIGTIDVGDFGDPADSKLPYEDIAPIYDDRYIRNNIGITAVGGDPQITQDKTSIERYFIRSYSESTTLIATDSEAASRARFLLNRFKEPFTRLESITLRGDLDPVSLWPALLSADLTNRLTATYEPVSGIDVTKDLIIDRIRLSIKRSGWLVEWGCSAAGGSAFILGVSLLGGTDVLLY